MKALKVFPMSRMLLAAAIVLAVSVGAWPQDVAEEEGVDVQEPPPDTGEEPMPGEEAPAPPPVVAPEPTAPPPAAEAPPAEQPAPEEQVEQPAPEPAPVAPPTPARPRPVIPSRTPTRPGARPAPGRPGAAAAPQAPAQPPNEFRPKNVEPESEPMALDFDRAPIMQVIEAIGAKVGKNFDVDPGIGNAEVTIITHRDIPPELAYELLQSILASRGFDMVETLEGNLVKIVPTGEAAEKHQLFKGKETPPPGFDTICTYVIGVEYADASELSPLLRSLGSQKLTRVDVHAKSNTLIITDTADGIRNILTVLEELDVPGYETSTEIFVLEYARAEMLAGQIEQVLLGTEGAARTASAPRPPTTARPPLRPNVPGQQQSLVVGSSEETLRLVSDERLNALIVVASPNMMERVRDLIKKLDTHTPFEANNMHIYELLNADAEKVAEALNQLISGTGTPRQSAQQQGGQTGEVQPFEKKVTITQYEQTNALLIVASPQDYAVMKELISQLDRPRRQVHVEAVIIGVGISDNFTLAVETTALTANDAFALSNVVQLANILSQGPLATAGPGITAGVLDGTTRVTIPDGAGGTTVQTIPNVPLLLTALEQMTDLEVLSQPSLTTVDNEEASFIDGQEVPFITGTSRNLDQSAVNSTIFSRVSREDVGVKLTVTPQISEGDYVFMELNVEVSKTVQSDVGADANVVGPTVQKSEVQNKVVIPDAATGVMGGLIQESSDRSIRQPPILGDLPGVGWLFRRKGVQRAKRNLVVLVTPYIVKQGADLDRVTKAQLDDFHEANVDLLFEKGFISKIKKRQYMRNKYRPGDTRLSEISGDGGFGRGNMEQAPDAQRP